MAQQKELALVLNLYRMASIIEPVVNMLVQDDVKQVISTPAGCMWKTVKIDRVCSIPYAKGVRFQPGEWSERKRGPKGKGVRDDYCRVLLVLRVFARCRAS